MAGFSPCSFGSSVIMRKFSCLSLAASLIAGIGWAAQATVIFTPGNNPPGNEENILFGAQPAGMTLTGTTNQTGTAVQFTSTQNLTTSGIGQADLEGAGIVCRFRRASRPATYEPCEAPLRDCGPCALPRLRLRPGGARLQSSRRV
jgi:hypothetical protein